MFTHSLPFIQVMMLDEEIIARRNFWRRSSETLKQLSAMSAFVHTLVLSEGMAMKFSKIKANLGSIKDHAKSLSQVNDCMRKSHIALISGCTISRGPGFNTMVYTSHV